MLPNTTIHIKDHGELNQPNSMRIYFAKTPNKSYSGNTVHSNTITLTLGIKKRKKKIVATLQNTFRVDTSTLSLHCCSQCCYHEKMSCNTGHWLRFNHVPLRYEIKIINTIEVQLLGLSDLKIRTSMGKIRSVCFFSSCACILNNTYLIEMNTKWPKWRFLSKYHVFWIFFFSFIASSVSHCCDQSYRTPQRVIDKGNLVAILYLLLFFKQKKRFDVFPFNK